MAAGVGPSVTVYGSLTSSPFVFFILWSSSLVVYFAVGSLVPVVVTFPPPLLVTTVSYVPLLITFHPLGASRSNETHSRSAQSEPPLPRFFLFPDSSDECSSSPSPPREDPCLSFSSSSISKEILSLACIRFKLYFVAKPKLHSRLSSTISGRAVSKMGFRSLDFDGFKLHFQTSLTRNALLELDVSNLALRALISLQFESGNTRALLEERIVFGLITISPSTRLIVHFAAQSARLAASVHLVLDASPFLHATVSTTTTLLTDIFSSAPLYVIASLASFTVSTNPLLVARSTVQECEFARSANCSIIIAFPAHYAVSSIDGSSQSRQRDTQTGAAIFYGVHLAQSRDLVLEFCSLFFEISQVSRVYTFSAPFLLDIRVKSRHLRPFLTVLSYGPKVTELHLSSNSFQQSSIENSRRSLPPMVISVTNLLVEVKERLSSSVLASTNRLQTRCLGSPIVGSYTDLSMFLGTSVLGSQVKHLYGFLHPFNTSIALIVVVFVYGRAVEFTSGCNRLKSFAF